MTFDESSITALTGVIWCQLLDGQVSQTDTSDTPSSHFLTGGRSRPAAGVSEGDPVRHWPEQRAEPAVGDDGITQGPSCRGRAGPARAGSDKVPSIS